MPTKYDTIGLNYNSTRRADPYLTKKLLEHLNPKEGDTILDIGCGTGNYTNELEKRGLKVFGIDPSERMLKVARQRNENVEWKLGSAEDIPLPDQSVDGIVGFLTLHHWTDLKSAFCELNRVLKPNGNLVFFTSTPQQMEGYWVNHYFPKMMEASTAQMPSLEVVEKAMNENGIVITKAENYFIQSDLQDKFLSCGKQNPEMYFDEDIRKGISSFAALANCEEVEKGLSRLREDITSGKFAEVAGRYENDLGEYLFLVAKSI
ncbi:MAG: methyltransferase domain-containing protein [Bacteroidota bacterium]